MKSISFASTLRVIVLAALCNVFGAISQASAQGNTAPVLTISGGANQSVVLSWFADYGVTYQLESSSDLASWTNFGSAFTGTGDYFGVTYSIAGHSQCFFRLKSQSAEDDISAVFDPQTGLLTITGDDQDNVIIVSRDNAGNLQINGGAVSITGGVPTLANTTLIQIFGHAGHDQISLNESNGALPQAYLFGEAGNDTLTGGSGADVLNGGPGLDTLLGRGGADSLLGGDDSDVVIGGAGNDVAQLGMGDDRFIWNPGDGTDVVDGADGIDITEVNGGNGDEEFTVTANGTRVRFDRITPTPFFLDIGTVENLVLNANGGNDKLACTGNLAALIKITADGGPGEDTLLGSNGNDLLLGGDDNDFIDGQQGSDTVFMGAGNDTFQWDPGDGSDTVGGQDGADTLLFNGSAGAESFGAWSNGARVMFSRNLGNVVMGLDDVEILTINALGNTDSMTIWNLAGTPMTNINIDLAGTLGGANGDGVADTIEIFGTNYDDVITATLPGGDLQVAGLAATITVGGFDASADFVRVYADGGEDVVDASAVGTGGPPLFVTGGSGNDILLGSVGDDILLGESGDDVLLGLFGTDTFDAGVGNDVVIQDGGQATSGIVSIFGDEFDNTFTISRDSAGRILSNNVPIPGATIANTVIIRVFGRGGNDTITLNEALGNLPTAWLFGGPGNDTITSGSGNDLIFGGTGNDTLFGKNGVDLIFGGAGNDTLTGGDADDQVFGEANDDRFVWTPGDDSDLIEGGTETDTVVVNGGNGAETFTTTANGTRVRFDRITPAPFFLDIGACEQLILNANGGNDSFSATGNLAALIQITVDGGTGEDTILGSNGSDVLIGGDNNDFIDGQQGNDTVYMGEGDDVFQWDPGDGSDILEGEAGNDSLLFNGSNIGEIFDVSANGPRVRFTRNVGSIVMDFDDIENLDLNALGGNDLLTVNDLSGTDLINITADLAATLGGGSGDALADNVIVNATAANDTVTVFGSSGTVSVTGLSAMVTISGAEAAYDRVTVNTLGGHDVVDASALLAGLILFTADGGADDDILIGSDAADTIYGGPGDDVLIGGPGLDALDGGPGDNVVIQD